MLLAYYGGFRIKGKGWVSNVIFRITEQVGYYMMEEIPIVCQSHALTTPAKRQPSEQLLPAACLVNNMVDVTGKKT